MILADAVSSAVTAYSVDDFVKAFGAGPDEVGGIAEAAGKYDFLYHRLGQAERDAVILGILNKIDSFSKVGAHRANIWESCWSDAKAAFTNSHDVRALNPVFMGANTIVRMHGDYACTPDAAFETQWFRVMRSWLFSRHLKGVSKVFEFGCGSGYNLLAAGTMFPGMSLTGLDWSPSAVELIDSIGATQKLNLQGRRFDFFNPDVDVPVDSDSVALTVAALEQVGPNFVKFAEWLISKRPKLVLSIEPISEFYDPENLFGYLGLRYHTHREYLDGYYSWVKAQAEAGRVEIVHTVRPGFGSIYHEAYSVVAWRPV